MHHSPLSLLHKPWLLGHTLMWGLFILSSVGFDLCAVHAACCMHVLVCAPPLPWAFSHPMPVGMGSCRCQAQVPGLPRRCTVQRVVACTPMCHAKTVPHCPGRVLMSCSLSALQNVIMRSLQHQVCTCSSDAADVSL